MFYYSGLKSHNLKDNPDLQLWNCKRVTTYIDDISEEVFRVMQSVPEKENGEDIRPSLHMPFTTSEVEPKSFINILQGKTYLHEAYDIKECI